MEGRRTQVSSPDGTVLGLLTAGSGPPLVLVHGGLSGLSRWAPLWPHLTGTFTVTALDRRGRGSSGDAAGYSAEREYDDVATVAAHLAAGAGRPVDVLGHSWGACVTLGAAARGAPLRRLALYEPPGPPTVPADWRRRLREQVEAGRPGPALVSFLTEVIGLSAADVAALREQAGTGEDVLGIVTRTFVRESEAIAAFDPAAVARDVAQPVLLLRGTASPPWAATVVDMLAGSLPDVTVRVLEGHGHEGVDTAAAQLAGLLRGFLLPAGGSSGS